MSGRSCHKANTVDAVERGLLNYELDLQRRTKMAQDNNRRRQALRVAAVLVIMAATATALLAYLSTGSISQERTGEKRLQQRDLKSATPPAEKDLVKPGYKVPDWANYSGSGPKINNSEVGQGGFFGSMVTACHNDNSTSGIESCQPPTSGNRNLCVTVYQLDPAKTIHRGCAELAIQDVQQSSFCFDKEQKVQCYCTTTKCNNSRL
ncbi:unnamed protein product, partial [Mesorhabditis spiculigera]